MSSIIRMGEILISHLEKKFPSFSTTYYPGITRAQVEIELEKVNCQLPQDFYDLYEWRNGHPSFFNQPVEFAALCHFSAIEDVANDFMWKDWDDIPEYNGSATLPFVRNNSGWCYAISLNNSYEDRPYIIDIDEVGHSLIRYDSIESMLATTVNCFEEGVFFCNDQGWLCENEVLAAEILSRNNPKTLSMCLLSVTALDVYGFGKELGDKEYSDFVAPIIDGLASLQRYRPSSLISRVEEITKILEAESSNRSTGAKHFLREWLRSVK
jgi:hypothetical protein